MRKLLSLLALVFVLASCGTPATTNRTTAAPATDWREVPAQIGHASRVQPKDTESVTDYLASLRAAALDALNWTNDAAYQLVKQAKK